MKLSKQSALHPLHSLLLIYFFVLCALLLLFWRSTQPTISYLHSWNQVTTLASIRAIVENPATWFTPQEVVARVTASVPNESRFIIFEEFPLYHLLVAAVVFLGNSLSISIPLELAGRLISIASFLLGAWSLSALITHRSVKFFTVLLYLTSFPMLYYGQAVMSDMAMGATALTSLALLLQYQRTKITYYLFLAHLAILMSMLCKSYSIVILLPWSYVLFCTLRSKHKTFTAALFTALFAFIAAAPVLSWHVFAFLQEGNQEPFSHSLESKLSFLTSSELFRTLWKYLFRYLGPLPAILSLLGLIFYLYRFAFRPKPHASKHRWLYAWLVAIGFYLLATADKLADHDYYFLLLAPVIFIFAGALLARFDRLLKRRFGASVARSAIAVLLLSNLVTAVVKFEKATRINTDVMDCVAHITDHTEETELIATLTDVSRFNAHQYYSQRRGLVVEQFHFPANRYQDEGAAVIVVNLPQEEFPAAENWLAQQTPPLSTLVTDSSLRDFRSRTRVCGLYRFTP